MKDKKSLGLILMYIFIFTVLPVSLIAEKVQALEGYSKYDKESTRIGNKYNIKNDILKVEQYSDYTLALTKEALYFIENGQAKKYSLGEIDISPSTNIKRNGKYIYLAPYKENTDYKLFTIDKEKFEGTSSLVSKYIPYNDYILQEIMVDNNSNKWVSLYKKSEDTYELLKVDNMENSQATIIGNLKAEENTYYTDVFKNMKLDSKDNIWFKITETNNEIKKYMLGKISKEGKQDNVNFNDNIIDYEIANDDTIWLIHKDKIVHAKADGQVIKSYSGTYLKDICKDSLGNIWILDGNKVSQLVNDEFKVSYEVKSESKELSVSDKDNIVIRNIKGITLIVKGQMEEISVNSYVNNTALVLKDSSSEVRLLSDNYRDEEENKYDDDVLVEAIIKDGSVQLKNTVQTNFENYYNSTVYKDEVYFASNESVYVLRNNSIDEYVKLFTDENYYDRYTSMVFDNSGNLYIVGSEKLYVVDKDTKVQTIDLAEATGQSSGYENKLLKDKGGDLYLVSKSSQKMKINKLNKLEYRSINYRDAKGNEPVNVFLSENDELEFVYSDNKTSYKVYKLDENLLPVEDIRLNSQGNNLTQTYYDINGMYKTGDEKLILWIGSNMIYVKDKEEDVFKAAYDIPATKAISSMARGSDGKVYIGTYGAGVISYGENIKENENSTGTIPEDYEDKATTIGDKVSENKEWIIKFSQELDKITVNESNVIVVNSSGEKQDMKVLLDSDNLSIKLTPQKSYSKGESYYIIVKETIKSLSGKQLNKPMIVKFVVEEDKTTEDDEAMINELNEIKFEIEIPASLGTRDKSFIDYIVNEWKSSFEKTAKEKGITLTVGKALISEVSVGTSTAYISLTAEVHTVTDKGIIKETQIINLNCKKQDGVWQIIM